MEGSDLVSRVVDQSICPVCSSKPSLIGVKNGRLDAREYVYLHCEGCRLSFVGNPRTDYAEIYNENYYKGLGADPMVDYDYEMRNPAKTIRNYEWNGVLSIYRELSSGRGRWLDFGCGCGGLVSFARQKGVDIVGFDEGWGAQAGRSRGIPILTEAGLKAGNDKFDFISAIEVLEHVTDPVATLKLIRSLLNPGGILFLTTGNAKPWRSRLLKWGYIAAPEVHVSFYEPETLALAFQEAGLEPRKGEFFGGYVNIVKYKVLKALRVKNVHVVIDMLPWRIMTTVVDGRHQVTRQPYAMRSAND